MHHLHRLFLITLLTCPVDGFADAPGTAIDERPADWLERLIVDNAAALGPAAAAPEQHRLQAWVGEVVAGADGTRSLREYAFRLDADYLYPASAIKAFGAVGALTALQALGDPTCTVDSRVVLEPLVVACADGEVVEVSERRSTTLRRLIEGALIVSSNESYNALFEIAGIDALNTLMRNAGFSSMRLNHRLSTGAMNPDANRFAPRVTIDCGDVRHELAPQREVSTERMTEVRATLPLTLVGQRYRDEWLGETVEAPMDFAAKNQASLRDLAGLLIDVVDPTLDGDTVGFTIADDYRVLLREIMSSRPPPADDGSVETAEARFKPLTPGISRVVPRDSYVYLNKAGRALGFHLDAAYVENTANGRSFYVAVGMFVDVDGTMNDDRYAYETVSFPFFVGFGELLARELLVE
jgi:hypothetical protein